MVTPLTSDSCIVGNNGLHGGDDLFHLFIDCTKWHLDLLGYLGYFNIHALYIINFGHALRGVCLSAIHCSLQNEKWRDLKNFVYKKKKSFFGGCCC